MYFIYVASIEGNGCVYDPQSKKQEGKIAYHSHINSKADEIAENCD